MLGNKNESLINSSSAVYFPSLNGIRFIAATMVIVHHCIDKAGGEFLAKGGEIGVTLFFVLSGFLITYLLLKEKQITGTIDVKAFYIRRILRIWPLYFFAIFITLLLGALLGHDPGSFFTTKLVLYCLFLSNVAVFSYSAGNFPSQLWSVSSEEQFYLVWPWLVKWLDHRRIWRMLLVVALFFPILRLSLLYITNVGEAGQFIIRFIREYIYVFRVDCMALGGIAAFLFFEGNNLILNFLYKPIVQILAITILVWMLLSGVHSGPFQHTFHALPSLVLILNLATNKSVIFNLENKVCDFMGKISYGSYVYHPLIILLMWEMTTFFAVNMTWVSITAFIVLCIIFTTVVAYLSYEYFEKRILKYKRNFTKILSGDQANGSASVGIAVKPETRN